MADDTARVTPDGTNEARLDSIRGRVKTIQGLQTELQVAQGTLDMMIWAELRLGTSPLTISLRTGLSRDEIIAASVRQSIALGCGPVNPGTFPRQLASTPPPMT